MSVTIMAKNYAHCPLKKRPYHFLDCIKDEPENLSTKPEDLSLSNRVVSSSTLPSSLLVTPPISPSSTVKTSPSPPSSASPPHFGLHAIKSETRLPTFTTAGIKPEYPTHNWQQQMVAAPSPIYYPQAYHYIPYQYSHYDYNGMSPTYSSDSSLSPPHYSHQQIIHQPLPLRPAPFAIDPAVLSPHSSTTASPPPPPPPPNPEDLSENKRRPPNPNPNATRHQCPDCGKSYSTFSGLSKHRQFHCAAGDSPKKSFSCKYCEKIYVSLGALKMHIRTHTLPCKCTICGKAFSRPWLLQGHIRTHTGEKPFSCSYCNRAFADRSNLRAHLQTHSDVKKYSCPTCSKTFSRMSLVTKHAESGCSAVTPTTNGKFSKSDDVILTKII